MFFDWLEMYQDHDHEIAPREGSFYEVDALTGEYRRTKQPTINHKGSFATSIQVRVSGPRVWVGGNPSKWNRPDNLFGHQCLDSAVRVFNHVLLSLGLPPFIKGSRRLYKQTPDGKKLQVYSDGAIFTRIDITENRSTGEGNTLEYIKAVSTQHYRHMIPQLYTNGRTADWKTVKGNARHIYPTIYDKAHEIGLHDLPKIARACGTDSPEYKYLESVQSYCRSAGVVRFEQKLKSEFLRRIDCAFWGLFNPDTLKQVHTEFLSIDERLQVTAMTYENISDRLIRLGVVDSTKAAMTTSQYAIQWMHGAEFDLSKSAVKTHRARLRKLGIDIARPCDISRHSPVYIRKAQEIQVSSLPVPDWYQMPARHQLKAA